MGKGAKIAIGCGLAAVAVIVISLVGVFGAGWWLTGKVKQAVGGSFEQLAETQKKIDEFEAKANANPFTRPADGVIQEDRLVRFLAVRKAVYAVYEKHKAEIEAFSKNPSLSGGLGAAAWTLEIRLAQAQGLADEAMNKEEYLFMVESVYRSLVASEIAKSAGTETASEAIEKAQQEGEAALKKAAEDAKSQGVDLGEAQKQWEEAKKGMSEAAEGAKQMDVPKENIALFRKYEAEIKRYAMGGLEFIGL